MGRTLHWLTVSFPGYAIYCAVHNIKFQYAVHISYQVSLGAHRMCVKCDALGTGVGDLGPCKCEM